MKLPEMVCVVLDKDGTLYNVVCGNDDEVIATDSRGIPRYFGRHQFRRILDAKTDEVLAFQHTPWRTNQPDARV